EPSDSDASANEQLGETEEDAVLTLLYRRHLLPIVTVNRSAGAGFAFASRTWRGSRQRSVSGTACRRTNAASSLAGKVNSCLAYPAGAATQHGDELLGWTRHTATCWWVASASGWRRRLLAFGRATSLKMGAPEGQDDVIAFVSGTLRNTTGPLHVVSAVPDVQRVMYNGHTLAYGVSFQGVMGPNGITTAFQGPYTGNRHNAYLLERPLSSPSPCRPA
ncbi:unnamed protein product, partial [Phaeothamnion confervicola]